MARASSKPALRSARPSIYRKISWWVGAKVVGNARALAVHLFELASFYPRPWSTLSRLQPGFPPSLQDHVEIVSRGEEKQGCFRSRWRRFLSYPLPPPPPSSWIRKIEFFRIGFLQGDIRIESDDDGFERFGWIWRSVLIFRNRIDWSWERKRERVFGNDFLLNGPRPLFDLAWSIRLAKHVLNSCCSVQFQPWHIDPRWK